MGQRLYGLKIAYWTFNESHTAAALLKLMGDQIKKKN